MSFNKKIISLIENTALAWNTSDLETMATFLEEDIIATVESVTIGKTFIEPMRLEGKENVMEFITKIRKKLPLRYQTEFDEKQLSKRITYSKYFYQLGIRAHFVCVISEYGKYREFHITKYENVHSEKINTFNILKNMVRYKIKSLFSNKA